MEGFGGISVDKYLKITPGKSLPLGEFLEIMIQLTEIIIVIPC